MHRSTEDTGPNANLDGELYRVLAESAPDAIITIDEESTILSVNSAVERLFGYATEEMIGRSLSMLMPARMRGGHFAGMARYAATEVRHISWQSVRLPILTKSGVEIPVEIPFGEFVANGRRFFSGFVRDVSERAAAEHALNAARKNSDLRAAEAEQLAVRLQEKASELEQQTEEAQALSEELEYTNTELQEALGRYRALVDASTLMVWETDPSGAVEDMPFWRELTGQTLDEVRGSGWATAIHPDDRGRMLEAWQRARDERRVHEAEYRVRLVDGTYRRPSRECSPRAK